MVYVADLLHKRLGLAVAVGQEVLADTAPEALGLSHIDDISVFVLHQVAARIQRKGVGLCLGSLEVLPSLPEFLFCNLLVDLIAQADLERVVVHQGNLNP